MKTATVRQLKDDFGTILAWIGDGEQVRIHKDGKTLAVISPPSVANKTQLRKRPKFAARLRRIFGNTVLQGDTVVEERESRLS